MKQMKRKANFQRSAGPLMKPFSFVFDHFFYYKWKEATTCEETCLMSVNQDCICTGSTGNTVDYLLWDFKYANTSSTKRAGSYIYWASQKVKGAAEFRVNVKHSPARCCQGWLMHLHLNLYHSCNWTLILFDHLALWHRPYCVMAGVKPRSWRVTQTHVIKSAFPCVNKSKVAIWQLNKDVWRVMRRIFKNTIPLIYVKFSCWVYWPFCLPPGPLL